MTDPLAVGTGDLSRLVDGNRPEADVPSGHRYSPLRERVIRLRGSRLLPLGVLGAPLVMAGYVGLTMLLFLPLLGLRRMFPRGSTLHRSDDNAPLCSGMGNLCHVATRSA
jgi:hypothetical protein